MSQVRHLGAAIEELTLLNRDLQSMFLPLLKHHLLALEVGTDVLGVDCDAIKADNQDFQQFVAKNCLHNPLERCWGTSKPERHLIVLEQP